MERKKMKKTDNKCVFCGADNGKWGNNAMPLNEGRCCDFCNDTKVIPARIKEWQENKMQTMKTTITSKKFKDSRTGEIVTTFLLKDIKYMSEVK